LTGSAEAAVSVHVQCRFGQKTTGRLTRRRPAFKLQCVVVTSFLVYLFNVTNK